MIAICVESSHARGMGHLFRMSYLADEMHKRSWDFTFVINQDKAALEILASRNFPAVVVDYNTQNWLSDFLETRKIELWIDDRLQTDLYHSMLLKEHGIPIITFDNSGDGATLADLSIYGMAHGGKESLKGKTILTGLQWNLIDPQIYQFRRQRTELQSLVITFGGTDTYGMTPELYCAVHDLYPKITIVTGPGFQHDSQLESCLRDKPHSNLLWKKNVPSLAEEFFLHDIAITAGGITPFEANAAGLPCIIVATETHEVDNAQLLASFGGAIYAGFRREFHKDIVRRKLDILDMSKRAMTAIPDGAVEGILTEMAKLLPTQPKVTT